MPPSRSRSGTMMSSVPDVSPGTSPSTSGRPSGDQILSEDDSSSDFLYVDSDITEDEEYDFDAMHETDEETVIANPDSSGPEVAAEEARSTRSDNEVPTRTEDHAGEIYHNNRKHATYYRERMQRFDEKEYMKTVYAPGTEAALNRVLQVWRAFCRIVLERPWRSSMKQIDLRMLQAFFEFFLNQCKAKDGRRKRPIKITRSLQTFWNNFTLVYRKEALSDPYLRLNKSAVRNLLVRCHADFDLSTKKRDNRPMTLEDLRLQIETTLSTTEKYFKLGEQRLLAVLYLLLIAPVGARPNSILEIRLGDLQIGLHRPRQGPVQLLMFISLETTKAYLGPKGSHTFMVPEVIYDPSLFLSPHVYLLAILFKRRAFRVDELNDNPRALSRLTVLEKEKTLVLPLKKHMLKDYLFCGTEKGPMGYFLSEKRISGDVMHNTLLRIGRILGYEGNTTAYTLRYMAGNNMNQEVNISRELQNLVMGHAPNSDTFQRNYLNRNITFDLWALQRGLEPQQEVIHEAASFGYYRSARRPLNLSQAQLDALKKDPEYEFYSMRLAKAQKGSSEYAEAQRELRAALKRLRYAAERKILGKDWTERQAVDDIIIQITGDPTQLTNAQRKDLRPPPAEMSPAQQAIMDALCRPMNATLDAQLERRHMAIEALIAYCSVQEPLSTKILEKAYKPATAPVPTTAEARRAEEIRLRKAVTTEYDGQRLSMCFLCVAQAIALPAGDPNIAKLCHKFCSPASMHRHFKSSHLRLMDADGRPEPCPVCVPKVTFKNMMQFRNHAQVIHGIRLWSKQAGQFLPA